MFSVFTNLPDEHGRGVQWYLGNGDASVRYCTVVSSFTKVSEHMAIYLTGHPVPEIPKRKEKLDSIEETKCLSQWN